MGGCPFSKADDLTLKVVENSKSLQSPQPKRRSSDFDLKAVMATVLDGLIIIDQKGTICAFNPSAVRIFGYEPEEVMGQNVKMLMPDVYASEHDMYLSNYLNTKQAKVIGIGREVLGKRKNGEVFSMELGVNEMNSQGQLMFVGTVRDITDRKRAEQEIHDYILALKRSNQELDDFAYIASHDLKEPLRGLSNNAIFLKEDHESQINQDGIERIDRIIYLAERMERLVNDLLYFSRIGRQDLAVQTTDLNLVIEDITSMLDTLLKEENVEISIPQKLPDITCDNPRITEVFRNLITNAIKYNNKNQKVIEIGFQENDDYDPPYIFYVKDNGIGIEQKFYDDIFRIFKRLNVEDDSVKGTGVGLTFVKKIVERHGGIIWLESEPDVGTTFYFTIHNMEDKKNHVVKRNYADRR